MAIAKRSIYLLIALLVLGNVAAFSSRAVFIDEHIFLTIASKPADWIFPNNMEWLFFGNFYPYTGISHPPLGAYYLGLVYQLIGDFSEVPFRLAFAVFGIVAALSFYALAKRFTKSPALVTILFLASPAFFVMSQTLMMDVPMLACLLAGLALYLDHTDGRPRRLVPASICFIAAAGFGYTVLVPLGSLFICSFLLRRPKQELVAIASAPIALALWLAAMTAYTGAFPLTPAVEYLAAQGSVARNLIAIPTFLGGITVFPWLFVILTDTRKKLLVVAASLAVAGLLSNYINWLSTGYGLWFILLASSGLGLLISFGMKAWQLPVRVDKSWMHFLVLWAVTTLAFFAFVGEFISARYLLLAMPALYLALFRNSERRALSVALVPTLVMSVTVAIADYKFVNVYRDLVDNNVAPLQEQGFQVWSATESGLRFYLEQRDIETLSATDLRPAGGSLIVRHVGAFHYGLSSGLEPMLISLKRFDLGSDFPVRTFSRDAGAGFHDSNTGIVPFWFSNVLYEQIEIAQVSPFVDQFMPARSADGKVMMRQTEPQLDLQAPLPRDTRIETEFEGRGEIEVIDGRIRLLKGESEEVVWKNLRIVPLQF